MLAIIPARGGSKGVPKKNIRVLNGKPLIHWTIEVAFQSDLVDRVVLSTDDEEIAKTCEVLGVEIPFMRPKWLAQDDSLAIDNYIYTMDRLIKECNFNDTKFVVLLPTSPFRASQDIDASIKLFNEKQADSVISVTQLSHPVEWVCNMDGENRITRNSANSKMNLNRQDFETAYIPNGSVYVFDLDLLKNKKSYYSEKTYAYPMPQERSVDIDTEIDFLFAEFLMSRGLK